MLHPALTTLLVLAPLTWTHPRPLGSDSLIEPFAPIPEEVDPMLENCKAEIVELHQFFESWFRGSLAPTDESYERFASVLGQDFELVSPAGVRLSRTQILTGVRAAHTSDPDAKIEARAVRVRTVGDGLFLATYEEWQTKDEKERGRTSSALLRAKSGTAHGVEWLHLHETWLE